MSKIAQAKSKPSAWHLNPAALGAVCFVAALSCTWRLAVRTASPVLVVAGGGLHPSGPVLAQETQAEDESEVAPEQVEKYIAVYKAMQRNHGLKVEQAAASQGLSLDAFRDIERRIERDDMIRERVRQALRGGGADATAGTPAASASPSPPMR